MSINTAMIPQVSQVLSISSTNASATIAAATTVRVVATTDCFIRFGAAATTTTGCYVVAYVPEYFEPGTATTLQAITSSASGSLYITPMG